MGIYVIDFLVWVVLIFTLYHDHIPLLEEITTVLMNPLKRYIYYLIISIGKNDLYHAERFTLPISTLHFQESVQIVDLMKD